MIWFAAKRSPCIPPLLAEPFVGTRVDDLEGLCNALTENPYSMWQFGDHVLIRKDRTSITIAPYRMQWDGPHTPVVVFDHERAVGGLQEVECFDNEVREGLSLLVRRAEHRRKSAFRECVACGNSKPPEWLDGKLCFECFEQSGGVH